MQIINAKLKFVVKKSLKGCIKACKDCSWKKNPWRTKNDMTYKQKEET